MTANNSRPSISLDQPRDRSLQVRALYEVLEKRFNGKVWSLHEIMIGFSNDVGTIGRLLLAHDGTWDIDGDVDSELQHKLAESLWWIFVLADRLDIDMSEAFSATMDRIQEGLEKSVGD